MTKHITLTEADMDKACNLSAEGIMLALMNYRATAGTGVPGVRVTVIGQPDLPPQFTLMCKAIVARHVRSMLDGILD